MPLQTFIPHPALQPFISHFAIDESAEEKVYKVLPGTSLVAGFQFKGKLFQMKDGSEQALAISGISGLADHQKTFKNSPGIGTVLVFFKEAGAHPFFKQPLHELFRESVSLDNFMLRSELLVLEEKLYAANKHSDRIHIVEEFLIGRMSAQEPDKLVMAAIALIHQHHGNIRIKDLAQQLHTSQSPLEKRFRQAVGASPKKFASIVRLKFIMQQYPHHSSLTELGYEAGYYDQAHFIKEFKTMTGDTPEKFFSGQ